MTEIFNLCPEKNQYASGEELQITEKQENAANFEPRQSLPLGLRMLILPQKNTAVKYDIPEVGERISKRLFAVVFDAGDNVVSIRTIGVPSIKAIAFEEEIVRTDEEGHVVFRSEMPQIGARTDESGAIKAVSGSYKVRAIEDSTFIKGKDLRYVVTEPTVIVATRLGTVWVPEFKEQKIQAEGGNIVLGKNERFYFFQKGAAPSSELVEKAKQAIAQDESNRFFYGL